MIEILICLLFLAVIKMEADPSSIARICRWNSGHIARDADIYQESVLVVSILLFLLSPVFSSAYIFQSLSLSLFSHYLSCAFP